MVGRVAVIDGKKGLQGYTSQSAYGGFSKIIPVKDKANQSEVIVLQLKRETLADCKIGHLSGHFSYKENIVGRKMVIWCTGGGRGFQKAYFGTVERVSRNTELQFALRLERKASPNECYIH